MMLCDLHHHHLQNLPSSLTEAPSTLDASHPVLRGSDPPGTARGPFVQAAARQDCLPAGRVDRPHLFVHCSGHRCWLPRPLGDSWCPEAAGPKAAHSL